MFGAEPHVFRPERWLDGSIPKRDASVGVYGNLFVLCCSPVVDDSSFSIQDDLLRRRARLHWLAFCVSTLPFGLMLCR